MKKERKSWSRRGSEEEEENRLKRETSEGGKGERKAWFVLSLAWGGAVAHVWEVEEKGLESVYRSPSHSLS